MGNLKLILSLFLFLPSVVFGQVTIGNEEAPLDGALLDLKNIDSISGGNVNATKGLLLPRVALEEEDQLYPMFRNDPDYDTDKDKLDKEHSGLMVYNLADLRTTIEIPSNECDAMVIKKDGSIYPGIAIWDGSKWYMASPLDKSLEPSDPGTTGKRYFLVKDIEGNLYTASDFGDAGMWMTQNMRSRTFDTESEGYAAGFTFDTDPSWGTRETPRFLYPGLQGEDGKNPSYFDANNDIGLLYNHAGALGVTLVTNKLNLQGICPNGWRIPRYEDAEKLEAEMISHPEKYTISKENKGNYNWFTNCGLSGIGKVPNANSLSVYNGGFALFYLSWAHLGQLWEFGENGAILWLSSTTGGNQQIINISDTSAKIQSGIWADNRSMTVVRCIKK